VVVFALPHDETSCCIQDGLQSV